jgi:hypothetical protein
MSYPEQDLPPRLKLRAARGPKLIMALGVVAGAELAACASSPVSEVKEVGPGVYSLTYAAKKNDEAMQKAGAFCHARGQQLSILHDADTYEVRFQCVAAR